MTRAIGSVHWAPDTGSDSVWWIKESKVWVKVTAEQTAGHFGMWEWEGPYGAVTPLHVHKNEAEGFVVLEGSFRFFLGDERIDATAGDTVMLPKGIPHAYGISSERGRVMGWVAPGGMERFFIDAAVPLSQPAQSPAPPQMMEAGNRYQIEVLGPPPSLEG